MMPPLMTVGSNPPASSSAATIEVVVVLPWVPAMATQYFSRIISASISARRTTGRRCARAATSSGLSGLIAEETTTTPASPRLSAAWPMAIVDALVAQALDVGAVGRIRALNLIAEIVHDLGDAAHADAADADEMDGADVRAAVSWFCLSRMRHAQTTRSAEPHGGIRRCRGVLPPIGTRRERRGIADAQPAKRRRADCGVKSVCATQDRRRRFARACRHWPTDPDRARAATAPESTAGRSTASSATVEAPERRDHQMARRHALRQIGEEGGDLGADAELGIGAAHALLIFAARLLDDGETRPHRSGRSAIAAGTISAMTRAPWRAAEHQQAQRPVAARDKAGRAAAITAGRTGLPVSVALAASAASSPSSVGKAAWRCALTRGARKRLARPITAFCSCSTRRHAEKRRRRTAAARSDSRRSRRRARGFSRAQQRQRRTRPRPSTSVARALTARRAPVGRRRGDADGSRRREMRRRSLRARASVTRSTGDAALAERARRALRRETDGRRCRPPQAGRRLARSCGSAAICGEQRSRRAAACASARSASPCRGRARSATSRRRR